MHSVQYKTWIELKKQAVFNNVRVFRALLKKKTGLFAVVKSNAYGHGLHLFSKIADEAGVDGFCVDSVVEGLKLRLAEIKKPIISLGPTMPVLLESAKQNRIILTISNFDFLKAILVSPFEIDFHLKIDTGMHRQGFYLKDIPKIIKLLKLKKNIHLSKNLKGLCTHFAAAKDITYPNYTLNQISEFVKAADFFKKAGFKNLDLHAAATGGTVLYPKSHFDIVRVGIGLYGYWPTKEIEREHFLVWGKKVDLKPVLEWKSIISEIKDLKKGDFVGYDLTEKISRDLKEAIIPIGYWHGLPRSLSGKGRILVQGKFAKILGRVSMDLINVSLPDNLKIKPGERATLIGKDKNLFIGADELAEYEGTIHYEILTRLNPLIKRIVV